MIKSVKQVRAALSLLNPASVRERAERRVDIGLVASTTGGYAEMEDFLIPPALPREAQVYLMQTLHRAGDPEVTGQVDLVLYEPGLPTPQGAFTYYRDDPQRTVTEIVQANEDLSLALARHYPLFRQTVVNRIVQAVAWENALFAVATALPNIVPNLFELPWVVGEFASDTAFLTVNQIRMAFMIAGACGKEIGLAHQKGEVLTITGGAFGWRALARELAGKIPLGGGLIPKGAIAYAGTFVIGKGLEHYHHARAPLSREQRNQIYEEAYQQGKIVAESATREIHPNA
ncbi:MAG TPA: hypothetical protein VKT49_03730 [Bryobacteraceae bacterium]|nr:hypothetical protein [Bryobacteraceae bacterium]